MEFQQLTPQKSATLFAIVLLITHKTSLNQCRSATFHHLDQIDINDRLIYFRQQLKPKLLNPLCS